MILPLQRTCIRAPQPVPPIPRIQDELAEVFGIPRRIIMVVFKVCSSVAVIRDTATAKLSAFNDLVVRRGASFIIQRANVADRNLFRNTLTACHYWIRAPCPSRINR